MSNIFYSPTKIYSGETVFEPETLVTQKANCYCLSNLLQKKNTQSSENDCGLCRSNINWYVLSNFKNYLKTLIWK